MKIIPPWARRSPRFIRPYLLNVLRERAVWDRFFALRGVDWRLEGMTAP